MPYLNQKVYARDPQVLYNNKNTNNLYGVYIDPEKLSMVGRYRRILAGSFLGSNQRPLARSKVIAPYVAAATSFVVDNPWAFLPGDVLYEIGDNTEDYLAERLAVANAVQEFGTVVSVDAGTSLFQTTVTPSAIAVGDVYTLKFEEVEIKVTAATTVVADLIDLIKVALADFNRPEFTSLEMATVTYNAANIVFQAKELGLIFTIATSVTGAGALDVLVAPGAGTLTITPAAGNNNQVIGAKVGVINDRPVGVITETKYLNDDRGLDLVADFAAYDMANVYKKSLLYLDGSIVDQLPRVSFFPAYGN